MRVLFIPPGTIQTASARLRAYWVAECMEDAQVIPFDQVQQADIDRADVVIWGKRLEPFEQHAGQRIYWDICDPVHWFNPQDLVRSFASACVKVVTSNDNLTADFNNWYGRTKAVTIPDRLKLSHYREKQIHVDEKPIKLLWFGNYPNRWALMAAMGDLLRLRYYDIPAELTICDDRPDLPWQADEIAIKHVRWSLDTENELYSSHDIAILPQMGGRNGFVKSNNKRVTAWANALPVFDGTEPFEWLVKLCTSPELRNEIAAANYHILEQCYQVEKSAEEWHDLLFLP